MPISIGALTQPSVSYNATDDTVNIAYQKRLLVIDLLRGLVLLLMVLDHTRDFFGYATFNDLDLTQTTPLLFLTRWVTHLCAPTFSFLAGVSAYLFSVNHTRKELSQFLLLRGVWLIVLELTVVTFAWKFTLDPTLIIQVIYALGMSMVILAGLIWLPRYLIHTITLAIIIGQQLLVHASPHSTLAMELWSFVYGYKDFNLGVWNIMLFYSIIPWFAVMSLGYCLGLWFEQAMPMRAKPFYWTGLICVTLFCLLRYFNLYGDPSPWLVQARGNIFSFLSFINVSKYPASLLYLLLTLGLVFIFLPLLEKWNNRASRFVVAYGKVSLFFYLLHLYLVHFAALIYSKLILQAAHPEWWWGNSPWITHHYLVPAAYHFSLARVYLVWLTIVILAYPLCLAYGKYKASHSYKWLSYL